MNHKNNNAHDTIPALLVGSSSDALSIGSSDNIPLASSPIRKDLLLVELALVFELLLAAANPRLLITSMLRRLDVRNGLTRNFTVRKYVLNDESAKIRLDSFAD